MSGEESSRLDCIRGLAVCVWFGRKVDQVGHQPSQVVQEPDPRAECEFWASNSNVRRRPDTRDRYVRGVKRKGVDGVVKDASMGLTIVVNVGLVYQNTFFAHVRRSPLKS